MAIDIIGDSALDEKDTHFYAGLVHDYYVTLSVAPIFGKAELCVCFSSLTAVRKAELFVILSDLAAKTIESFQIGDHDVIMIFVLDEDWISRMHAVMNTICQALSDYSVLTGCPACGKEDDLNVRDTGRGKIYLCDSCASELSQNLLLKKEQDRRLINEIDYDNKEKARETKTFPKGLMGALLGAIAAFVFYSVCMCIPIFYSILLKIANPDSPITSGSRSFLPFFFGIVFFPCAIIGYLKMAGRVSISSMLLCCPISLASMYLSTRVQMSLFIYNEYLATSNITDTKSPWVIFKNFHNEIASGAGNTLSGISTNAVYWPDDYLKLMTGATLLLLVGAILVLIWFVRKNSHRTK